MDSIFRGDTVRHDFAIPAPAGQDRRLRPNVVCTAVNPMRNIPRSGELCELYKGNA